MKRFKTTHFRILGMIVLFAGLTLTSCKNSSTSAIEEEDLASSAESMGVMMNNAETSNVYFSDENVLTYDHINAPTVSDWTTSVCKDDGSGSIGLNDPRWTRTVGQTAYNIRPLLSGGLHAFEGWWGGIHSPTNFGEAEWINSINKRFSVEMNSEGGGHNWTRYELPVDGNGTFELKLLADNCSWIYLDDELVGYQDDSGLNDVDNIRYGVTLDGPATLTYIIYDGGGDAGGKFRLETTTEDIPEFEPPTPEVTVYTSEAGIQTWDPISPSMEDPSWPSTVCTDGGSIGLGANWVNPHDAFDVEADINYGFGYPVGIHPWVNDNEHHQYEASWINAVDSPLSTETGSGTRGDNWTRYQLPVEGNGEFVIQLLADNCSWIYLDGEVIGYQDEAGSVISDPNGSRYGVTLDGEHTLDFIIYDGGGLAGGKFRLETASSFGEEVPPTYVPPTPVNNAPSADAGEDQTVTAGGQTTPITLDGTGSSDPDGGGLTYSWTGAASASGATPTVNLPDGTHTLTLTVSDGELTDSDEVTITVVNTIPVANAGGDITKDAIGQTTPVNLDGSNSSDADGDALTYSWSDGSSVVSTDASFTTNLADGTYTFTLTVSDGEESDMDEVNITVLNTIPVADAGDDITTEATGPTTPVTLNGSGTDADGDSPLTFDWSGGLTGANPTVELGVGVHTFTLTVSDGQGASDTDEVVVEITDDTAPDINTGQVTNSLWPPNHKMVLVASGISATDIVDGFMSVDVTVSSSESSNGKGDGNTNSDYEIVTNPDGSKDVYVRAERSGKGKGRTYTISMSVVDAVGNDASGSFEVQVAKSQGRGR